MTNFVNPKPYISEKETLPEKQHVDKTQAMKEAIEIIRENKKIVEEATKSSNENSYR